MFSGIKITAALLALLLLLLQKETLPWQIGKQ